ncbi:MAG: C-GCAxxG-C-C family protein [Clostridiales bacterium]|jgi:C_GCAxxG_C_C family probable redox protein|nr:C-GCAxxG-C-C family protein [Clostridiales bacterium]
MLYEYLANSFLYKEDWNCAEHVLIGANRVYGLGLSDNAIKLAAGFGAGVSSGDICGALAGAVMALGALFVNERAHESDKIKVLTNELLNSYREKMGQIDCTPLKAQYRTEESKCRDIILEAAGILDGIVAREKPDLACVAK